MTYSGFLKLDLTAKWNNKLDDIPRRARRIILHGQRESSVFIKMKIIFPRVKLFSAKKGFFYQGALTFNSLPLAVRQKNTFLPICLEAMFGTIVLANIL
jgi:hypothetical protein